MRRWMSVLVVLAAACAHTPERSASAGRLLDVRLERLSGGQMALGSLAGQTVVVNFFATWCLPCVAEVPYLNRLDARPDVTVVAISMDEGGREVLGPFAEQFGVRYPILLADEEIMRGRSPFGPIPGIPATFLLDPRGHVVVAVMGLLDPKTFDRVVDDTASGRLEGASP